MRSSEEQMRPDQDVLFTRRSPEPKELERFLAAKAEAMQVITKLRSKHAVYDLWNGESFIVLKGVPETVAKIMTRLLVEHEHPWKASVVSNDGGIPGLSFGGRGEGSAKEVHIRNPQFQPDI